MITNPVSVYLLRDINGRLLCLALILAPRDLENILTDRTGLNSVVSKMMTSLS